MTDYAAGKPWKMEKQQHILEAAYKLFSENGIVPVTMPDIAKASGVGRATVFRYFGSKLELVIAIGTWKWEEYIESRGNALPRETIQRMNGAEYLRFYLDAFLDLYHNQPDILRFNYDFNSYLRHEKESAESTQPYMKMAAALGAMFHVLYERGMRDGTLNPDISEEAMFSGSFHIMLAAATRYAVGLVYVPEKGTEPESELRMLEELLLGRYTKQYVIT